MGLLWIETALIVSMKDRTCSSVSIRVFGVKLYVERASFGVVLPSLVVGYVWLVFICYMGGDVDLERTLNYYMTTT